MTVLAVSGTPTTHLRPGISFAKASSKAKAPLTISAVTTDGLFGKSPLVPGVVVLTINGKEATWMHPDEAKAIVKSGERISITVEAFIAKIVRKKRLEKLGIVLKEIKGEKGLLIEEITENSPFLETDLIQGMKIVNINGARCPNRPKEALKLMQKIFGTMKVVAVQTNRDLVAEKAKEEEAVMNWTLSQDSVDPKAEKQKAVREAQLRRKVQLRRKLSKQDDKSSSVKGPADVVRSRSDNSEESLKIAEKPNKSTDSGLAEGYTVKKSGSFVCDLDECDSDEGEPSEKSPSKRFNFQSTSPAAAISKLKEMGKKKYRSSKKNASDTDDATATTTSSKYFNFDHPSPSEAMAKLKKITNKKRSKDPNSKRRRRKKKKRPQQESGDAQSPHRPRTVDFAGQVRKVRKAAKKARSKQKSTAASLTSSTGGQTEVASPDDIISRATTEVDTKQQQKRPSIVSRISPSKAVSRISPTKAAAAIAQAMPFGQKQRSEVKVVQTEADEIEVGITEQERESRESSETAEVEDVVMMTESKEDDFVSDAQEDPKTGENWADNTQWPSETYNDTTLAFAGLTLVDPKRATSPRNMKDAEENVPHDEPPTPHSVVVDPDEIPQTPAAEPKIEETSTDDTPSDGSDSLTFRQFMGEEDEYYYSDEYETDSEYDSYEDDDYSGSEGEWPEDESVADNDKVPTMAMHVIPSVTQDEEEVQKGSESSQQYSRSHSGDLESTTDRVDSGPVGSQTKQLSMEIMDSRDDGEDEHDKVTVHVRKSSKDDLIGFKINEYEDREGIYISEIVENSGLRHSGLKPGMKVTKVNGKEFPKDFDEAVSVLKQTIGIVEIQAVPGLEENALKNSNTVDSSEMALAAQRKKKRLVDALKNTDSSIAETRAENSHEGKKSVENALMVPKASSFIGSQLNHILSDLCLSGEDDTPEMIVQNF